MVDELMATAYVPAHWHAIPATAVVRGGYLVVGPWLCVVYLFHGPWSALQPQEIRQIFKIPNYITLPICLCGKWTPSSNHSRTLAMSTPEAAEPAIPVIPVILTITKFEAARRQLGTAIVLWFSDDDPVSIHTLACAAYEIIHKLTKKRNPLRQSLL